MRKALSTTQRLALFFAAQGHCQGCGWRLHPGTRWEVDHIIPVALGGTEALDNLQVLCKVCHGVKTARRDAPALSKAKRLQARHLGATRPKSIIPGSTRSGYKKQMNRLIIKRWSR